MKNQGVPLYAISISNEPDWCGEWACWSADEIYNFTKGYADKMRKNGVKVISTESFRYDKNLYNKVLNDANALKNWDILGAHFYASDRRTGDNFFQYSLADQKGVERWMTEHYTESQPMLEHPKQGYCHHTPLVTLVLLQMGYTYHMHQLH